MKFRWSGAVADTAEAATQRLNEYLAAIGYRAQEPQPRWARGSRWKALLTLSPRQLPIFVEAKLHPWGSQTLVDVTYEFPPAVRALSELDAELLVAELRGLTEYLQHGRADFEAMALLERAAVRMARRALLRTLGTVALLAVALAWGLSQLALPLPVASLLGGALSGLFASYLFWRFVRRR